MNRLVYTLFAAVLLTSCSKSDGPLPLPSDNGCIERRHLRPTDHGISAANVAIVNNLFQSNNINNSTYRYYQYYHNPAFQTQFPPFATFDDKIVKVDEYTNGLRIFTGQLVFQFKNNVINFTCCEPTNGTTLNTTPRLTLPQLRALILGDIEQFDHRGAEFKDSCFSAEFGYFDLNRGSSGTPERLVKAWRVTVKGQVFPSEYPLAYYEDDNGKLIYYDNGIRTFTR